MEVTGAMENAKPRTQRRHPPELRERAVRIVEEISVLAASRAGLRASGCSVPRR